MFYQKSSGNAGLYHPIMQKQANALIKLKSRHSRDLLEIQGKARHDFLVHWFLEINYLQRVLGKSD